MSEGNIVMRFPRNNSFYPQDNCANVLSLIMETINYFKYLNAFFYNTLHRLILYSCLYSTVVVANKPRSFGGGYV